MSHALSERCYIMRIELVDTEWIQEYGDPPRLDHIKQNYP